jgi:hypothetical protein
MSLAADLTLGILARGPFRSTFTFPSRREAEALRRG